MAKQKNSALSRVGEIDLPEVTMKRFTEAYVTPRPQDLLCLKEHFGLTGAEMATIVGVHDRTVRKWLAPRLVKRKPNPSHQQIPYAA